jgi:hypothetical protein
MNTPNKEPNPRKPHQNPLEVNSTGNSHVAKSTKAPEMVAVKVVEIIAVVPIPFQHHVQNLSEMFSRCPSIKILYSPLENPTFPKKDFEG